MTVDMSDSQLDRLYRQLDEISNSVKAVQKDMEGVIRLQEKVNTHEDKLTKLDNGVDELEERTRLIELWQAERSDTAYFDAALAGFTSKINSLESDIKAIQQAKNINKGEADVAKSVFKWATGLLATVLAGTILFIVTK